MKKGFLSCVAIAILMVFLSVGSVFAADEATKNFISSKVGIGYQGMIAGNLLNGASVRGWIGDRIGLEGNFF
jgi:purine-cytosine permease-like protein